MSNRGTVTAAYFLINLLWAKSYYQQTGQLPSLQPKNRRFIYDEILKKHPGIPRASIRRIVSESNPNLDQVIEVKIKQKNWDCTWDDI